MAMHPNDIQSAVKKAGFSASAISREFDVSHVSVVRVIQGASRSQRIEERIAEVTDIPLYRLWPQWYSAPAGVSGSVPMGGIDFNLLETVERQMEDALRKLVPGLVSPLRIKARHRCAVYNNCIKKGQSAQETVAGTRDVVDAYFAAARELDLDMAALANWALYDATNPSEAVRKSTGERSISTGNVSGSQVNMTGDKQSLVMGNRVKKKTK
jgi:lambda repressor-like predicted transcriptional regulator